MCRLMKEYVNNERKRMIYYLLSIIILLLSFIIAILFKKNDLLSLVLLSLGAIGGMIFLRLGYKYKKESKEKIGLPMLVGISVLFFVLLLILTSLLDVWSGSPIIRIVGCLGLTFIGAVSIYKGRRTVTSHD